MISIALAAILLSLSGCANFKMTPALGATAVRLTVGAGLGPVLSNNPKYVPVALALSAGIDAAIGNSTVLTLSGIDAYVKGVCEKYKLPDSDVAIFTNLVHAIYIGYTEEFKVTVIKTSDPQVLLYVNAFKNGVNDAVLTVNSTSHK